MLASKVACPSCHSTLKSDRPLPAGHKVKCPRCGTHFTVPGGNGENGPAANGNGPTPATAIQVPHLLPAAAPAPLAPEPPAVPKAPPRGNNTALLAVGVAGGLLLLLLLGGVVLWACVDLGGGDDPPPPVAEEPSVPAAVTPAPAVKPRPKPLIVLPPEQQAKVDSATQRGVAYLKKIQQPDGSWTGAGHAGPDPLGYTGLAGLALIECGVPKDDLSIQKAASFIRGESPGRRGTYPLSLAILFLDHLGDPADEQLIRDLGLRLAHGQTAQGGWSYECPLLNPTDQQAFRRILDALLKDKPEELLKRADAVPANMRKLPVLESQETRPNDFYRGGGDNSNTQFALLAVLAARRHNLNLDPTLALIARRFRSSQNADGSWNYAGHGNATPWPTMTCAGLLGVAVDYGLAKDARKLAQRPEQDPAVQKGLEHVSKHIGETIQNPKAPVQMFRMYYLWCVERVGVLYRLKDLKGKRWFEWGMDFLTQNQHEDGSWPCADNHGWTVANTCFALLFLQRVDLAEDLTVKLREVSEMSVWRDDAVEGEKGPSP